MLIFLLLPVVYMLIRNECVYRYCGRVADFVFADLQNWRTLLIYMDSVSYDNMMYLFWVWPLRNFYKGTPLEGVR